jgi:hypothetical protein
LEAQVSASESGKRRKAKAEKQRLAGLPRVPNKDAAWALFRQRLGDVEYDDNYRSGFMDDPAQRADWEQRQRQGCCGSFDMSVMIDEREFVMGCNYGH